MDDCVIENGGVRSALVIVSEPDARSFSASGFVLKLRAVEGGLLGRESGGGGEGGVGGDGGERWEW